MLEIKVEESETSKDNNNTPESPVEEAAAPQQTQQPELEPSQPPTSQPPQTECNETTLNPLNEPENHLDTEAKGKQRRYWTPKEEERFFEIWGRENWRLTRHGKNTIFFAKWAEEMKERFNIDVKTEEIQCKVNQTRAKFRSVKKLLESDKNAPKWKKYDLVEKILKNQYRSKDDEPVPQDALENNRDMSPTELLNCETRPSSPNGGNTEQEINLNQTTGDPQLTDEVNMSNISLSDHNLTSNVFSNTSQSSTSFSTELFGGDQLDIKKEIEADLAQEGYSEFISIGPNEEANTELITNSGVPAPAVLNSSQEQLQTLAPTPQQPSTMVQQPMMQQMLLDNTNNSLEVPQISALTNNRTPAPLPIQNHTNMVGPPPNNADGIMGAMPINHVAATTNNHIGVMQPPKQTMAMPPTPSPRKRGARAQAMASASPLSQDALENLYLEEVRKKNVIMVEQGEINRKRLRLEERKVKLMEEFFPKYLTLQQEILQKLDTVASNAQDAINIKMEN